MTSVVFDISMSLDGYVTAANQTAEMPTGPGGEALLEWAFGDDPAGNELLASSARGLGAVIAGRTTYDHSLPWWEANGPTGADRRPVFVVTHEAPASSPDGGVYEFVTGGIEEALTRAKAVAGDGVVAVMGGADLARQYIAAGLVDEISIHLVPVLFGGGTRLFDAMAIDHTRLEVRQVIDTPKATHLRYRVVH
jgi:dihydrofolate reductase